MITANEARLKLDIDQIVKWKLDYAETLLHEALKFGRTQFEIHIELMNVRNKVIDILRDKGYTVYSMNEYDELLRISF